MSAPSPGASPTPDDGDRVATAWLGPDVALGAETGHRRPLVVGPVPRRDRALAAADGTDRLAPGRSCPARRTPPSSRAGSRSAGTTSPRPSGEPGPVRRSTAPLTDDRPVRIASADGPREARPPAFTLGSHETRAARRHDPTSSSISMHLTPFSARDRVRHRRSVPPSDPDVPSRPMAGHSHGNKAVVAAMLANAAIAIAKFVGFALTHVFGDAGRGRPLGGRHRQPGAAPARRAPGQEEGERRAPLRVRPGALLLVVRRGAGALHARLAVRHLRGHPQARSTPRRSRTRRSRSASSPSPSSPRSFSFRTAIKETRAVKGDATYRQFIRHAKVPELPVVLLEDLGALTGLVIALGGDHHRQRRPATPTGTPTAPSRSACCSASSPSSS